VTGLRDDVRTALQHGVAVYRHRPASLRWLQHHLDRLDEPLRLALAGKVKAGKSTLLNALVGEAIAATDAGECTRVVTWYVDGHAPSVTLHPRDGGPARQLQIKRVDGALDIDLDGNRVEQVDRLMVTWPSAGLRTTTLIDTPGIASMSPDAADRANRFLTPDDAPTAADAVLYLMRHLHAGDVRFLESFHDRGVARAAPVNTIAVLSRADEIGAGRVDALMSARRIAARYRADDTLRGLCQTVVAVAGLLAFTARTLRQDEYTALAAIAALSQDELDLLLLSADRFTHPTRLPGPRSRCVARCSTASGCSGCGCRCRCCARAAGTPPPSRTSWSRAAGWSSCARCWPPSSANAGTCSRPAPR
jgi:Dynamin family